MKHLLLAGISICISSIAFANSSSSSNTSDFDDDYVCFGEAHLQMFKGNQLIKEGNMMMMGTWGISIIDSKSIVFRDGKFKGVLEAVVTDDNIISNYRIGNSNSKYINYEIKLNRLTNAADIKDTALRDNTKYIRHFTGTCRAN
jgi:hypothetical protein